MFHDPRVLQASADQRASMHAKCIAVDRRVALITSANFTEAAQHRLVTYFEGLQAQGKLVGCML